MMVAAEAPATRPSDKVVERQRVFKRGLIDFMALFLRSVGVGFADLLVVRFGEGTLECFFIGIL